MARHRPLKKTNKWSNFPEIKNADQVTVLKWVIPKFVRDKIQKKVMFLGYIENGVHKRCDNSADFPLGSRGSTKICHVLKHCFFIIFLNCPRCIESKIQTNYKCEV